ncbi:MAG: VCBS repeat-containing protein [Gallionella sp.]|nr:MAG: VCBS repeat-containing protein [Gallionella sp.]
MKIEHSDIGLAGQHASSKQVTVEESLRAWIGQQRPDFEGRATENRAAAIRSTAATISAAGKQAAADAQVFANAQATANAQAAAEAEDAENQASNDPKMLLLISLIEALTGQKVKLFNPNEMKLSDAQVQSQKTAQQAAEAARANQTPAQNQRQGWGIEYDRHETIRESELTTFTARGIIKTSDGKEIQFDLAIEMKREFFRETNLSIREGDGVKKDPLVINFNGTAAQLTDTKFGFDLDSDGNAEEISFVGAGSGFLALDRNANGVIDNGSELFGTQSGNGFSDLSAYDGDSNNWIDENDAVYSRLQVWSKDTAGKDTLSALAKRNVGALYLGNVATPFDLKNSANDLRGQVRSSGVYLHEDGSAGTLQQVDLVV